MKWVMNINKSFEIYPRKVNIFICQLQSPTIFRLQAGYPIRSALGEKLVVVVREGSGKNLCNPCLCDYAFHIVGLSICLVVADRLGQSVSWIVLVWDPATVQRVLPMKSMHWVSACLQLKLEQVMLILSPVPGTHTKPDTI